MMSACPQGEGAPRGDLVLWSGSLCRSDGGRGRDGLLWCMGLCFVKRLQDNISFTTCKLLVYSSFTPPFHCDLPMA